MTKDQYLEMCEQMGEEPDWEKCPPAWEDFPEIVVTATNIFNLLGSRIYADVGYVGKDYTNFDFLLKQYYIDDFQKSYLFELITWLDARQIDLSQKSLREQRDKIQRQMKK